MSEASRPERIRLIIGLGNPGRDYERTRHNVGFMALDKLAARNGTAWRHEKQWQASVAPHGGALLCKPLSYMNLSGKPTSAIARFYKIKATETFVLYDDFALPLGRLRLRANGSAGGHNGMQSILECLGSQEVPRLRIGIGEERALDGERMIAHVLGRFRAEEEPTLEHALERALDALETTLTRGLEAAMNQYNQKT